MNALEIKNLCKKYRRFSLDSISLELPSGCIMGLIGEPLFVANECKCRLRFNSVIHSCTAFQRKF